MTENLLGKGNTDRTKKRPAARGADGRMRIQRLVGRHGYG
jgi:hypothetical protein